MEEPSESLHAAATHQQGIPCARLLLKRGVIVCVLLQMKLKQVAKLDLEAEEEADKLANLNGAPERPWWRWPQLPPQPLEQQHTLIALRDASLQRTRSCRWRCVPAGRWTSRRSGSRRPASAIR